MKTIKNLNRLNKFIKKEIIGKECATDVLKEKNDKWKKALYNRNLGALKAYRKIEKYIGDATRFTPSDSDVLKIFIKEKISKLEKSCYELEGTTDEKESAIFFENQGEIEAYEIIVTLLDSTIE